MADEFDFNPDFSEDTEENLLKATVGDRAHLPANVTMTQAQSKQSVHRTL